LPHLLIVNRVKKSLAINFSNFERNKNQSLSRCHIELGAVPIDKIEKLGPRRKDKEQGLDLIDREGENQ
jgi:hypothetical protein